jgi:hypothetical protein
VFEVEPNTSVTGTESFFQELTNAFPSAEEEDEFLERISSQLNSSKSTQLSVRVNELTLCLPKMLFNDSHEDDEQLTMAMDIVLGNQHFTRFKLPDISLDDYIGANGKWHE